MYKKEFSFRTKEALDAGIAAARENLGQASYTIDEPTKLEEFQNDPSALLYAIRKETDGKKGTTVAALLATAEGDPADGHFKLMYTANPLQKDILEAPLRAAFVRHGEELVSQQVAGHFH